ncbi:hypothetical protein B0H13DRAFT_2278870 [Mycena leptocephala]|nr:hypothetical protein B0H13DRAFT_2278870 [Mycena leptocephala]
MNFLHLPPELILACLSHLPLSDIFSCVKSGNRLFRDIILASVSIRYRREQARAGVEENTTQTSDFVISDRLYDLRRRELNWLTFAPKSRHTIPIDFQPTGLYDLTSDIYFIGDTADSNTLLSTAIRYMHTSPGSEPPVWGRIDAEKPIIDFGTALQEHDLIAFVTYTLNDTLLPRVASIDIQLRQFSTGAPHPLATHPVLHIHNAELVHGMPAVSIEIVGETLAISLLYWNFETREMDTLHLYNWKSGVSRMSPLTVCNTGLVFLTPEILIVPNSLQSTLEVYQIPLSEPGMRPVLLHELLLPELRIGILYFQCRGQPNPRTSTQRPSRSKFPPTPADALLLFTLQAYGSTEGPTKHIFVVNRAIFAATLESLKDDIANVEGVEWEAWGPRCTRWIDATSLALRNITMTSGQRMVSISFEASLHPAPIRILDFNPRHVDAQRAVGSVDGEHAAIRVVEDVQAPDWPGHLDAFVRPAISLLPYVEITSKEEFAFRSVLINDENIIGVRYGESGVASLEILHFG